MTAQTQLGVASMDDKMDMALSPYQPVDDLDLDFDQMEDSHQPQPDDDMQEHNDQNFSIDDTMAEENLEVLEDDEMLEDQANNDLQGGDADVEVLDHTDQQQEDQAFDDEDILYDEEEPEQEPVNVEPTEPGVDAQEQHQDHSDDNTFLDETTTYEEDTTDAENTYQGKDESIQQPTEAHDEAQAAIHDESFDANLESTEASAPVVLESQEAISIPAEVAVAGNTEQEPTAEGQQEQLVDQATIEDSAVDAALHSIRLDWTGETWRLFAREEDARDAFFHNTELAYMPMPILLEACRAAIPADELHDHDELTFVINELNLSICEDSKYAPGLTLAQIMELYLTLHRNGTQDSVALINCSLQSRACLQTYYTRLLGEALRGRSLTDVVGDIVDSPEDAEEDAYDDTANVQEEQSADGNNFEQPETAPEGTQDGSAPAEPFTNGIGGGTEARDFAQAAESVTGKLEEETGAADANIHDDTDDLLDVFDDEPEPPTDAQQSSHQEAESDLYVENTSFALDTEPVNEPEQHSANGISREQNGDQSVGTESHEVAQQQFAGDDDPDYEDPGAPAPGDDFYNSDEELLRLRQEEYRRASVETPNPAPSISFDIAGGGHDALLDGEEAVEAVPGEDFDLLSMPPETPQKGSDKKRKAFEEEDDFLLAGFDTPEPKRRRPS